MKIEKQFTGRSLLFCILVAGLIFTASAPAQVALTQLSQDTFTDSPSQHDTEVEPGAFSWGSTIVTAFQVARIYGGGGADIGFATSTDGGTTWTNGFLPGITIYEGNGENEAASDAAVAYNAKYKVWLVSTLPIGKTNTSVAVSRSTDGIHWNAPVPVTNLGSPDKNWIACDNTATSKYYGNCYSEWDDTSNNDQIEMSTSTDGGLTWNKETPTAAEDQGVGGVPLVRPNGTVIVPINGINGDIVAFTSTNGGKTWNKAVTVATNPSHLEAGNLRSAGLVASAMDAAGKIYVAWPDCRYRTNCAENDIIYSTTTTGIKWAAVKRVPIDGTFSTVDHFIIGLGIAPGTKGASAHLALAYYYYPTSKLHDLHVPALCRVYPIVDRRSKVERPGNIGWTDAFELAAEYFLRHHGRRLCIGRLRQWQGISNICLRQHKNRIDIQRSHLHHHERAGSRRTRAGISVLRRRPAGSKRALRPRTARVPRPGGQNPGIRQEAAGARLIFSALRSQAAGESWRPFCYGCRALTIKTPSPNRAES